MSRRRIQQTIWGMMAMCILVGQAHAQLFSTALRDVESILALGKEEAAEGVSVTFDAHLTSSVVRNSMVTLQSDNLSLRGILGEGQAPAVGSRVRVLGRTSVDFLGTFVVVDSLEVLERDSWPESTVPSRDLSDPAYQFLFVEVEGVVQRVWRLGNRRTFDLGYKGQIVRVGIGGADAGPDDDQLLDSRVRVQGVVGRLVRGPGGTRVHLEVPGWEALEVLQNAGQSPVQSVVRLIEVYRRREELALGNRVHVTGDVTQVLRENQLVIDDGSAALRVWFDEPHGFTVLDQISLTGFVDGGPAQAWLRSARGERVGQASAHPAIVLDGIEFLHPWLHHDRILTMEGVVMDQNLSRETDTIFMDLGGRIVRVELAKDDQGGMVKGLPALDRGTKVLVTGLGFVAADESGKATGLLVKLSGPAGLGLVALPSRWTVSLLLKVAAGLLLLLVAGLLWAVVLNRRIRQQSVLLERSFRAEHEMENRYRLLVEHANDLVFLLDESVAVTSVNGAVERTLGQGEEGLIGKGLDELVSEMHVERVETWLGEHGKGVASATFEAQFHCAHGRLVEVEISSRLIEDEGGGRSILAIARDITERQKSARRLQEQDDFFRQVIDGLPNLVFVKDRQGRFVLVNDMDARFFGKSTAEEMIGLTDGDVISNPAQLEAIRKDDLDVLETGCEKFIAEEAVTGRSRKTKWFQTSKRPIRDSRGNITHVVGVATEITARKEVEERVRESEALYHSLVENLAVGIFRKDLEGRFIFCNSTHQQMHGEDLTGRCSRDFLSPAEAWEVEESDARIVRTGERFEVSKEFRFLNRDEPSFVHLVKAPVFNGEGQVVGIQGMVWDMTEKHAAELKMQRLNEKLVEASRHAGMAEVATGVLHNVGNVLNSVNVSATLVSDSLRNSRVDGIHKLSRLFSDHREDLVAFLTEDEKGLSVPAYLETLASHIEQEQKTVLGELGQLMKYVEHIKEIVAMQQNYARMGGVVENVDPREIVEDAIAMNLAGLERHGIDLKRHYLQTGMVRVDKHKVLQILVNLIQNAKQALDFQDGSEEDRTVRVEVEMAGPDRVSIAVKDNGIGISGENLTKVFSHGFTTRRQGHGFGLHSGALAAREMGGALRVESEGSGLGATFTLLLPASVPDAGGFANATDLDDQDPDMSIKREVVSTD